MGKLCQMILLVIMTAILHSCGRTEAEGYLDRAEAVMDQDPDSAFAILTTFDSIPLVSENDSARYALLYNLARYKQFDDSLDLCAVKSASEYFVDHGDDRNAMMSLFLLGRIQTLQQQYGPAAISLLEALNLAEETEDFYYQGIIAHGLGLLYGEFLDSSHQLYFAKRACESFLKAGDLEWAEYTKLDLSIAYNNADQKVKAFEIADTLYKRASLRNDSLLMVHASLIAAMAAVDSMPELSAKYYSIALDIDSLAFDATDWYKLSDLIDANGILLFSEKTKTDIENVKSSIQNARSAQSLAAEGDYEAAFLHLDRYSSIQEEFVAKVLKQNLGETVEMFYKGKQYERERRIFLERVIWSISILLLIIFSILLFLLLRARKRSARLERQQYISDVKELTRAIDEQTNTNTKLNVSIKELFGHKTDTLNHLCELYYERNDKKILSEVKLLIKGISENGDNINSLAKFYDKYASGLLTDFRNDFPKMKNESFCLFLYLVAGFSLRSIAVLLGKDIDLIYTKKSRLKKEIKNSSSERRSEYLEYLG